MKMYRISAEQVSEIRLKMRQIKDDVKAYRRLEAVALRGEGKKNVEVSEITKFHPDVVGRLVKEYVLYGIEYLVEDGRKGGNNRNASEAEERKFLSQFEKAARSGQIITVEEISVAYDKHFGKEHKSKSTVYYLLHKHGWRKVMPRSKHPNKASDEEIESSKKLISGSTS
jgi:transposase